jgi:putative redox protein
VLVVTAHLESGAAPHAQTIRIGPHAVTADEPASRGGGDTGPSPTGLLLAALASCTAITLRMYADRKGWVLGAVRVDVELFRAGSAERLQRVIHLAAPLSAEQRARLLEIADKTPVTKMIRGGVAIATRVQELAGPVGR